jgi:glycosyltransferase involved in cell wall biosynthesis
MVKVFIVGYSLPKYSKNRISAFNYRTWQFVKPLLAEKHMVCLCAIDREDFEPIKIYESNLRYEALNIKKFLWRRKLQKIYNDFKPDCILGIGTMACYIVSFLKTDKPIWMDIYGDPVMENQIRLYATNTNRGLFTVIGFEKRILRKGDVFSTLSNPQKYALIGKLGFLGRLCNESTGYEFVHTILPGMDNENRTICVADRSFLRGKLVEKDDFVVLWVGGYNAWSDVDTLFNGLEYAMERNSKIKFISIGEAVVDPKGYPSLLQKIKKSRYKDRFIMKGWLTSHEDVLKHYREADLGISVDRNCYETLIGSRTRFMEMLSCGLPFITTAGCELSYILEKEGVCRTFPIGDFKTMGEIILDLSEKNILKENIEKKFEELIEKFSFKTTILPFLRWVSNPSFAPDKNMSNLLLWKERFRGQVRTFLVKTIGLLGG